MALFLIESRLVRQTKESIQTALDVLSQGYPDHLLEVQVSQNFDQLFVILEAQNEDQARVLFGVTPFEIHLIKAVRLVGEDLEIVKQNRHQGNYLVEWNLPAHLTMETYLKRKAEKTPLYAQVPEVKFERTYVCEDLTKCLCFYTSPDATAVERAREVVGAPIDQLTVIENLLKG